MPAKPKRRARKFRKYLRGVIQHELNIATLAAKTLIGSLIAGVVTEKTLVSSVVASWSLKDVTPGPGDGPLLVGLAHSDYTDAEIEAWIENNDSWNEGNKVQQEIARRKIKQVGTIMTPEGGATFSFVLNDGKPIKTKLNWILTTGQTLRVWAYNTGDSNFASTDPDMVVFGHANMWPR